jgi:hypothetical protein
MKGFGKKEKLKFFKNLQTKKGANHIEIKKVEIPKEAFKEFKRTELEENKPKVIPKKRIFWFNDPYKLANKIEEVIQKQKPDYFEQIYDLFERHTGAGKTEVYGTAFSHLAKKGYFKEIEKLYVDLVLYN